LAAAYDLPITATFAIDRRISGHRGSRKHKVTNGRELLADLYRLFSKAMEASFLAARDEDRLERLLRDPATASTSPHLGLVFSFLLLLRDSQAQLNGLTEAHLDFFYRRTLQIGALPLTEDRAHLVFELGKKVEESVVLQAGQGFKAGKDDNGQEIVFELPEDLVLTQTKVAARQTFSLEPGEVNNANLYAAPLAESGDGLGGKFPKAVPAAWPTLGAAAATYPDPETEKHVAMPVAAMGCLLASPVLLLGEGTRTISVRLTLGPVPADSPLRSVPAVVFNDVLLISVSTEEGWLPIDNPTVVLPVPVGDELQLELSFTLDGAAPAILNPGQETIPLGIPADLPALRLDFNPTVEPRRQWYCHFGQLPVVDASITVDVTGVRNLQLANDFAPLDPTKAFNPFGPRPRAGQSRFYVGSEEVFRKQLKYLSLKMTWLELPDFTDYYACYPGGDTWGDEGEQPLLHLLAPDTTIDLLPEDLVTTLTVGEKNSEDILETGEELEFLLEQADFLHHAYPEAILAVTRKNTQEVADEGD
ncbi:MAG: hypothetical protein AAFN92_16445, partial [Bacteroidota bacterium]